MNPCNVVVGSEEKGTSGMTGSARLMYFEE